MNSPSVGHSSGFLSCLVHCTKLIWEKSYLGCVNPAGLNLERIWEALGCFRFSLVEKEQISCVGQQLGWNLLTALSEDHHTADFFSLFPHDPSARKTIIGKKPDKVAEEREGHFLIFFQFCKHGAEASECNGLWQLEADIKKDLGLTQYFSLYYSHFLEWMDFLMKPSSEKTSLFVFKTADL